MAKSGVIYGSRQGNAYGPRLELHWSIVSQDIAKNTSHVKVISIFNVNAEISYGSNAGRSGSTTLGGSTKSYVSPTHSRTARTRTLGTTYHTVSHSSDGSFSGTLSGTFDIGSLLWAGVSISKISASGNIVLDEIVRGIDESSVMLATGWADTTSSKTITFTKFSSTAKVDITWRYWVSKSGGWSSVRTKSSGYTSGGALAFTSAEINEMHNNNPNTKTVKIQVFVRHFQGTSLIGSVKKEVTLNLKAESPSLTLSVVCSGTNQSLLGSDLRAVQNIHSMKATASGVAKNGATISRYQITFQGSTTSASTVTRKVTQAGTLTVTAQVWDSRGYSLRTSQKITSYAYKKPYLSGVRGARYTGTSLDPSGTDWRVTGKVVASVISPSGTDVNTPQWKIDSGAWVYSPTILQTGTLAIERQKVMTLSYADKFSGTSTYKVTIPTSTATFVLGKQSAGIGMVPPANSKGVYIKDGYINNKQVGIDYPTILRGAEFYTTDLNLETREWSLMVVDSVNKPANFGNFGYLNTICWSTVDQRMQVAYPYLPADIDNGAVPMFRNLYGGKWSEWQPMGQIAKDITSSGLNLNTIVAMGTYIQRANAYADTALNYPAAAAGILEHVEFNGFAKQTYTSYAGTDMWIRFRYSGTWRPWKSVTLV